MKQQKNDKLPLAARVAPAVGLLMFGDTALAQVTTDTTDSPVPVPEPSTLALLAAGGAVAGIARALKKKREK